jgi:hypothetical protein
LKIIEKEFKRYVGKEWDLNANKDMKKAHIWMKDIPEAYDWISFELFFYNFQDIYIKILLVLELFNFFFFFTKL